MHMRIILWYLFFHVKFYSGGYFMELSVKLDWSDGNDENIKWLSQC